MRLGWATMRSHSMEVHGVLVVVVEVRLLPCRAGWELAVADF